MKIEQMKQIVDGAPEGATHYVNADAEYWDLSRSNDHHRVWDDYWIAVDYDSAIGMDVFSASRLSDLKTIIAQAEEIERLRRALQGIMSAHRHTYGLDGAWDAELKAAEEALTPPKGEGE